MRLRLGDERVARCDQIANNADLHSSYTWDDGALVEQSC